MNNIELERVARQILYEMQGCTLVEMIGTLEIVKHAAILEAEL